MVRKDARKPSLDGDHKLDKDKTKSDVEKKRNVTPHSRPTRPSTGTPGPSRWWRMWSVIKYSLFILAIPPFLNFTALYQEAKYLKPQGEMYDIGFGQKLFMGCQGKGEPTVILDAPTGMSSDVWALVLPELAKITKVCVYDRAGLGFSERPRRNYSIDAEDDKAKTDSSRWHEFTVERMADDFRRLFTQASLQQRPFILVGSELGATIARFYAQIYENDVSDLVLVDPLVEDIFTQDSAVWNQFWFGHLVPSFQTMQLAAAAGITRLLLLVSAIETPMTGDSLPDYVLLRQKYMMCNPRHLSSVVDEHHFINESFSQMQTLFMMKHFPSNVSVTVITGNYYDEQLPSALNKAWAKSQQHLISHLHPSSHHIVVNGADHRMLYRKPNAVIEPIKRIIKQRRARTTETGNPKQ